MSQHNNDNPTRVARGIEFLDEKLPFGWDRFIDLDTLDLGSCVRCTIAQLVREEVLQAPDGSEGETAYVTGISILGLLDDDDAVQDLGFDGVTFGDNGNVYVEYAALTAEWRTQLAARRTAKAGTQ